jgi:alpha-beta hydrolase superfamily lysophospholipase
VFPAFANAAWLGIVPEFNPFKYNSFPVNGARQSSLVARALQQQITDNAREGRLDRLAPVLTFQSVVDFTVSTRAIIVALYANLPRNGSELVLFDLNRNSHVRPAAAFEHRHNIRAAASKSPRNYRTTIITNAPGQAEVVERVTEAGRRPSRRARWH